jgi:ATP-dependent DNA helicase RecG
MPTLIEKPLAAKVLIGFCHTQKTFNMRPPVLYPLFASLASLPGIGPRYAKLYEKLCGPRVLDLILHAPADVLERRPLPSLAAARRPEKGSDVYATLTVTTHEHRAPASKGKPWRITCQDAQGNPLILVYFHAYSDQLADLLPIGEQRVVSGKLEQQGLFLSMVHPDFVLPPARAAEIPRYEPVYPLTAGLSNRMVGKTIQRALGQLPTLPEWLDPAFLQQKGWPAWRDAVLKLHSPTSAADLLPTAPHRARLAYDELLAHQVALAVVRDRQAATPGVALVGTGVRDAATRAALPFALTPAQERALGEIRADMAASTRMLRLLQGDVGSGKTIVAFLAALTAIEAGHQVAIMAPTEILARQHAASMQGWAKAAGIHMAVLTGRDKGKARAETLTQLADGTLHLVVGTHALLQDTVQFRNLGLAIIDEQHRFGVHQRLTLSGKGAAPDLLVMTATPIPRTLLLTAFSDMAVSQLDEKPPGRKPIQTSALPLSRLDDLYSHLKRAIATDRGKAYWVCPLVEESELIDLAAATERAESLNTALGGRVGLVHGRMKPDEKDAVIQAFLQDELDVLVATTVIEVGVNVPSATIMVIEHAERFGLAQLHQLRGRVGRGERSGACVLLYDAPLSRTGAGRLRIMRETEDGFRIAEEDLRLRGAGDVLGTKQSGLPSFRLADWEEHQGLLLTATREARLILQQRADRRAAAVQHLLALFEKEQAADFLKAG